MKLLLSAAMLLVFANLAAAERKVMTWTVDGTKRQAIVYSPSKISGKAPLVFSFHGHGDTALNFEGVGLQDAWPEAVVVYPQGLASPRDGDKGAVQGGPAPQWISPATREDLFRRPNLDPSLSTLVDDGAL
jgi:poly(3-hydroxybutyrate) depolymerase